MSPDHCSKLTWDTVSAGGYDLFDPIGYLDRKRDRAYKQRVIVTDKLSQTLYNDCVNITCSDDDKNILEMHAHNSNNCNDYSLFNDDVPSRQSYGSINTVQHGELDIINMPANVHDSNNNDILSTIDPDRCINGRTNCHYFDSNELKTKFNKTDRFSIFHTNIRSSKQLEFVKDLPTGKSFGLEVDSLNGESMKHAHPLLCLLVSICFTSMFKHCYMPQSMIN